MQVTHTIQPPRVMTVDTTNRRSHRKSMVLVGIVSMAAVVFLSVVGIENEVIVWKDTTTAKTDTAIRSSDVRGSSKTSKKMEHLNHQLVETMVLTLLEAKENFIQQLQIDYGAVNYEAMFVQLNSDDESSGEDANSGNDTNSTSKRLWGREIFGALEDPLSYHRVKRVMIMKILRAILLQQQQQPEQPKLLSKRKSKTTPATTSSDIAESPKSLLPFVWALGGNSVAAGHGNLYSESYAAVVTRRVQPVLEQLFLNFTMRNYAASATQSAPETAFCTPEIYGTEVDVFMWDFSMTDGRRGAHKLEWFMTRSAALSMLRRPHRQQDQILLAYHMNDDPPRIATVEHLQTRGLSVLYSRDRLVEEHVVSAIPQTLGLTLREIDAMPIFIQKYRCGNQWEESDPLCTHWDKFNPVCPNRLYRVNWHPGWYVV
jgi:hypothetical protein